jgi:hypothetical protein
MPCRFFFNLTNGVDVVRDEDGIEHSSMNSALIQAMKAIEELRAQDPLAAEDWRGWSLEIVDASGRTVRSLPLGSPCSKHSSRQ